jgi:hypothetical protein
VTKRWYRSLCRRSHKKRLTWSKMNLHVRRWLPCPKSSIRILRNAFSPPELKVRARCGNTARRDLCGGRGATRVPTATQPPASRAAPG